MIVEKKPDKNALLRALPRLRGLKILVLGDLFLDEYVVGRAERLSREAPVPVLEFDRRFYVPGGAANPAHNISALGSDARQIGVVGDDDPGRKLVDHLREAGIATEGLVIDATRATTTKTRILAEGTLVFPQQLARLDQVDRRPLDPAVVSQLARQVKDAAPGVDALVVSDYKMGVVNEETIAQVRSTAKELGTLITVDSQGDLLKFVGFDVVKCNRLEAEKFVGTRLRENDDFERAGLDMLADLKSSAVVITRGDEGLSMVSREHGCLHLPATNRSEVFDVTGAGDTVIAVVALALAAGLKITEAVQLANYAAGLVVRKLGNATPTVQELAWAIEHWPEPNP